MMTGLPGARPITQRILTISALAALAAMLLCGVAVRAFVDPDMWHEMALFREALTERRLPLDDRFAYTPTVYPVIHHEWGTGAILYVVATYAGASGILSLKYLLTMAIAAACVACARRRGASFAVLCPLAPVAIFMSGMGVTTIRAQMFTMLMTVCLLYVLDRDREGRRSWLLAWPPMFVLWLNLHGGFVVSFPVLALHMLEEGIRRKPLRRLFLMAVAMVLLIIANPYGLLYYRFLWRALRLERMLISEWAPLWTTSTVALVFYGFSLVIVAYAIYRVGVARMPGLILLLCAAYAALRHQRHLSLYAIMWLCYVPAFVEPTRLGEMLASFWTRRPRAALVSWTLLGLISLAGCLHARPWRLRLPANQGEHRLLTYPVGAVDYLASAGFHGNLMVPFTVGAYVSWHLHPDVKVSIDGRYEVAYPPSALVEHAAFYRADPSWQGLLAKYPTDAVLIPTSSRVCALMPGTVGWVRVYRDDAYELYVQAPNDLPTVDRRGEHLSGTFP